MIDWKVDNTWSLFLDRDGVINERLVGDYVKTKTEFKLLPGVAQAISKANKQFCKVVVVTNQQGIGKGLMTELDLKHVHDYCSELLEQASATIDRYYFAPALSSEQSDLRKPNTGMAKQAQKDFPEINFEKSIMVGDSDSDIEFGRNLGMKTVFISSEKGKKHAVADVTFESLNAFITSLFN